MKDKILFIALGFIAVSAASYFLGFSLGARNGWNKAKRAVDKAMIFPAEPSEIFSISGEIEEIKDSELAVKTDSFSKNPLEQPETKTIKIVPGTELVKLTAKPAEEFQTENEAFMKAISESAGKTEDFLNKLTPPSLYEEKNMQFSDIKTGDKITAEAKENIKGKTIFEAIKISVFNKPRGREVVE